MPVPKNKIEEFFISGINQLIIEENTNRAEIYQPNDIEFFPTFTRPFLIIFDNTNQEVIDSFVSNMKNLFERIINNRNDSGNNLPWIFILRPLVINHLIRNFIRNENVRDDTVQLTYNFYLYVRNNETMRDLFGREIVNEYANAILNNYNDMIPHESKQETKKDKKRKQSNFDKEFKEFRTRQNYLGKKSNMKMIPKINKVRMFINQHKNRKLRHLKRAIIL